MKCAKRTIQKPDQCSLNNTYNIFNVKFKYVIARWDCLQNALRKYQLFYCRAHKQENIPGLSLPNRQSHIQS